MKQNSGFPFILILILLAGIGGLLSLYLFQMNNLEKRLISQSGQIRAMGQSADRLRNEVEKLRQTLSAAPPPALLPPPTSPAAPPIRPESPTPAAPTDFMEALAPNHFDLTPPEADLNGVLTRPFGPDPNSFNPLIEISASIQDNVYHYVGASLARRMVWTTPEKWAGDLARSVEIRDDYKDFTIHLRRGVKWHPVSGVDLDDERYAWLRGDHEFTARDVIFSLNLIKNDDVPCAFLKGDYENLTTCTAVDEYTVHLQWAERAYRNKEASLTLIVLPEFLYAHDENGAPFPDGAMGRRFSNHWYARKGLIGTGPYRFVSYRPGVDIRLERHEDYHGERPAIRSIIWQILADPSLTLARFKAGELDLIGLNANQYWDLIGQWQDKPRAQWPANNPFLDGRIHTEQFLGLYYFFIAWNQNKPLFADKRVRQALTMTFNRPALIQDVFRGLGEQTTGNFFIKSPSYDTAIEPWPFDPARARALLESAGWSDTDGDGLLDKDLTPADNNPSRVPFTFKFQVPQGSAPHETVARIFKADLLKIGIKMELEILEEALQQERLLNREYDATIAVWGLTWEQDPYQVWHSSQADVTGGSNFVGFRNADADAIIEELRATFDADRRAELCRQFHRILHEEQPYTFFYVHKFVTCYWDRLQRFTVSKVRPHTSSLPWWMAP